MTDKINQESETIATIVKEVLANIIGVEPSDINEEDSLSEDLHMSAADIADFFDALKNRGLNTKDIDITTANTVENILEELSVLDLTG